MVIVNYVMPGMMNWRYVHRMKTLEEQGMVMNHCLMLTLGYNQSKYYSIADEENI